MIQFIRASAASPRPVATQGLSGRLRAPALVSSGMVWVGTSLVETSDHLQDTSTRILGLPALDGWALIGGATLVALFLVIWALLRRGRRRGSSEDTFDSSGRPAR